jgi:membrane associated rhomboid family serine protease
MDHPVITAVTLAATAAAAATRRRLPQTLRDGASFQPWPTGTGGRAARAGTFGAGDPATVIAEARKALFVMVGFLAILWIVQIINVADHYQLTDSYGIQPRDIGSLPDILTAPFLHVSWAHIEGNSGPLFIFGFLAAYRGVTKFYGVTALVILTSGLGAWLTGSTGIGRRRGERRGVRLLRLHHGPRASSTGTRSTC